MSWLHTRDRCEITSQSDQLLVKKTSGSLSLTIVKTPEHRTLNVEYAGDLILDISSGVELPDGFCVSLAPGNSYRSTARLHLPVEQVFCTVATQGRLRTRLVLELSHTARVSIFNGDWHISGKPNAPAPEIDIEVKNLETELKVFSSLQVARLSSEGSHTYDTPIVKDAAIFVDNGHATFLRNLANVRVRGNGSVEFRGQIRDSHVGISGSMTAASAVSGCYVNAEGDFTAKSSVGIGPEKLICRKAHIEGTLAVDGEIICDELIVEGSVSGSGEFTITRFAAEGDVSAAWIHSDGPVMIRGKTHCDRIDTRGQAELTGPISHIGRLEWKADGDDAHLVLGPSELGNSHDSSQALVLFVRRGYWTGNWPKLTLTDSTKVDELHVDISLLRIKVDGNGTASQNHGNTVTNVDQEAYVGLQFLFDDSSIVLEDGRLDCDLPPYQIESLEFQAERTQAALRIRAASASVQNLEFGGAGLIDLSTHSGENWQSIQVRGGITFHCNNDIGELECNASRHRSGAVEDATFDGVPILALDDGIAVHRATGVCTLDTLGARVHGDQHQPLVIARITAPEWPREQDKIGHLTQVDVSELRFDDIEKLDGLRVLELSNTALRRFARERSKLSCRMRALAKRAQLSWQLKAFAKRMQPESPLSSHEIRERAETVARLRNVVGERVNSGSSRVALYWSVAHLQFRCVSWKTTEWYFRLAYRSLGYGFGPGSAFATWFLAAFVWAWWHNGWALSWEPSLDGGGELLEMILLPLSYLRLGDNQTVQLDSTLLDTAARVSIGIPFIFFVLGIRQYLRFPTRSDR